MYLLVILFYKKTFQLYLHWQFTHSHCYSVFHGWTNHYFIVPYTVDKHLCGSQVFAFIHSGTISILEPDPGAHMQDFPWCIYQRVHLWNAYVHLSKFYKTVFTSGYNTLHWCEHIRVRMAIPSKKLNVFRHFKLCQYHCQFHPSFNYNFTNA